MHISKIRQIVEWVSNANLAQFELHSADFSVRLVRPPAAPSAAALPATGSQAPGSPAVRHANAVSSESAPAQPAVKVAAMATVCGRFLSCHPLRDTPEVRPGDVIEAGTLVGLISVGELLLPVTATAAGTVAAFMVEDNQLVGYGTPLVSLA